MKVTDLAHAVVPGADLVDVGLRPGEKLHEEMISPEEGRRAVVVADGKYFIIQPDLASWAIASRRMPFRCPKASPTDPTATTGGTRRPRSRPSSKRVSEDAAVRETVHLRR